MFIMLHSILGLIKAIVQYVLSKYVSGFIYSCLIKEKRTEKDCIFVSFIHVLGKRISNWSSARLIYLIFRLICFLWLLTVED